MTDAPFLGLIKRAQQGDRDAAGQLVEENSGLIWSVARRFFGRGVDPDDLYQLGCVGFLKAVQGFDESFGTQFSTYAVPKISGEIRRFLRDDGAVKVSRGIKERAALVKNARLSLSQQLGREPTVSEVAEETGLTIEDIASCETATSAAESLQGERGEDGFTREQALYGIENKDKEPVLPSYEEPREKPKKRPPHRRRRSSRSTGLSMDELLFMDMIDV